MATGIIGAFYEFSDYLDLSDTGFYKYYCCNSIRRFFSYSDRVVVNPEKFLSSKNLRVFISN